MIKARRKKLVNSLAERIETEKRLRKAREKQNYDLNKKQSRYVINDKYISVDERIEIVECFRLISWNMITSLEELNEILKSRPIKFRFLIKVFKQEPSLFDELIDHGPSYVEQRIANIRRAKYIKKEMNK